MTVSMDLDAVAMGDAADERSVACAASFAALGGPSGVATDTMAYCA